MALVGFDDESVANETQFAFINPTACRCFRLNAEADTFLNATRNFWPFSGSHKTMGGTGRPVAAFFGAKLDGSEQRLPVMN